MASAPRQPFDVGVEIASGCPAVPEEESTVLPSASATGTLPMMLSNSAQTWLPPRTSYALRAPVSRGSHTTGLSTGSWLYADCAPPSRCRCGSKTTEARVVPCEVLIQSGWTTLGLLAMVLS